MAVVLKVSSDVIEGAVSKLSNVSSSFSDAMDHVNSALAQCAQWWEGASYDKFKKDWDGVVQSGRNQINTVNETVTKLNSAKAIYEDAETRIGAIV